MMNERAETATTHTHTHGNVEVKGRARARAQHSEHRAGVVGTHSRAGSSNNKNNKRNRTGSTLDVPPSPLTHSGQMRQHSTVRRMCARAPCALFWVRAIVFLSGAAFPNPVPSPRPDGWVRRNARTHPGQAQANDGRQRERDGCAQGERRCRFSAFLFDEPFQKVCVCVLECVL